MSIVSAIPSLMNTAKPWIPSFNAAPKRQASPFMSVRTVDNLTWSISLVEIATAPPVNIIKPDNGLKARWRKPSRATIPAFAGTCF
jgi:hypothetical protein